jgi:hypothetical protein
VLNIALPYRPCSDQPPLQATPQAIHSGCPYRPQWKEDLFDMSRVGAYLAKCLLGPSAGKMHLNGNLPGGA